MPSRSARTFSGNAKLRDRCSVRCIQARKGCAAAAVLRCLRLGVLGRRLRVSEDVLRAMLRPRRLHSLQHSWPIAIVTMVVALLHGRGGLVLTAGALAIVRLWMLPGARLRRRDPVGGTVGGTSCVYAV